MKKRIFILMSLLALILALPFGAFADQGAVRDEANLLTASEEAKLRDLAAELAKEYDLDIVIATVKSLDGQDIADYAPQYYDRTYGPDGILFLLSIADRQWYVSTCGKAAVWLSGRDATASGEAVQSRFSDGDYYGGFRRWLDRLPGYMDTSAKEDPLPFNLWISLGVGAAVSLVVILILRAGMNTKRRQPSAGQYLVPGSYHLTLHRDFYLYSHTTRTARPKSNGSGGSGGRSHGGGGGRF